MVVLFCFFHAKSLLLRMSSFVMVVIGAVLLFSGKGFHGQLIRIEISI